MIISHIIGNYNRVRGASSSLINSYFSLITSLRVTRFSETKKSLISSCFVRFLSLPKIDPTRIIVGKNNLNLFIMKYILLINVLLLTHRFSVGYTIFYIIYNSLLQTAYKQDVLSGFIKKSHPKRMTFFH